MSRQGDYLPDKPKHILQQAIGFELEDISTNEEGRLSDTQRQSLRRDTAQWLLFAFVAALFYVWNIKSFLEGARTNYELGSFILIFILAAPVVLFVTNKSLRLTGDFIRAKVFCATGQIALDVSKTGKGNVKYDVMVDGIHFDVSKTVFLAFKNNESYTIYYTPLSKRILSAYWLR